MVIRTRNPKSIKEREFRHNHFIITVEYMGERIVFIDNYIPEFVSEARIFRLSLLKE